MGTEDSYDLLTCLTLMTHCVIFDLTRCVIYLRIVNQLVAEVAGGVAWKQKRTYTWK